MLEQMSYCGHLFILYYKYMDEKATLGGGCYWCFEAFYKLITGVDRVVSGYSGGNVDNPTVSEVYEGNTGHAEVVQVTFNPKKITYREILEIFFVMHDPTTLNRQGYDVGEEYRSVIFYHSDEQRQIAEEMKLKFAPTLWDDPIITQIEAYSAFWPTEETMQDFYEKNPNAGYCQFIINPKIQKLRKKFAQRIK